MYNLVSCSDTIYKFFMRRSTNNFPVCLLLFIYLDFNPGWLPGLHEACLISTSFIYKATVLVQINPTFMVAPPHFTRLFTPIGVVTTGWASKHVSYFIWKVKNYAHKHDVSMSIQIGKQFTFAFRANPHKWVYSVRPKIGVNDGRWGRVLWIPPYWYRTSWVCKVWNHLPLKMTIVAMVMAKKAPGPIKQKKKILTLLRFFTARRQYFKWFFVKQEFFFKHFRCLVSRRCCLIIWIWLSEWKTISY